ncbi:MAG TPA: tol-pal system protein YbgF [Methylophilaceae bacterium]|nr:tol-pal system protein YbgF [Methylophilaceae bacterium]
MRKLILTWVFLLAVPPAAHAALFSDSEARERVKELAQQVQAQNQANQATLDEIKKTQQALEQRLSEVENVVKGQGLMDLLAQIDQLKQEVSNMKGQLEVATHNIEMGQQRQRDLYTDVDARLRKIESGATPAAAQPGTTEGMTPPAGGPTAGGTPPAAGEASSMTATVAPTLEPAGGGSEAKDFENAQALYQAGKYKEAFSAYEKFLQNYPNSSMAPEAQYALGYTQYSLKNYKAAMNTQQKLIKQYPTHKRVPDAMFSIANSQIQLSDVEGAKQTLKTLLTRYPNSEVAPSAKKRLAVLESIKSR